jgi:OOP family OmpA-OmpF porin
MRFVVITCFALAVAVTAPAAASPPAKAAHVDPNAPCFRWPAVDMDGDGVFDRVDKCVDTPPGCTVDTWGCSFDSDQDGVCDGVDQCDNTPVGVKVDARGCPEGMGERAPEPPREVTPPPARPEPQQPAPTPAPASETERQLIESGTIRLERVYFETNSASLLDESQATLDEAGAALAKYPRLKVEIQGHTDTRGSADHNLRLSQERAESVRAYLLGHFHIDPANLIAKGYGESQPETRERNQEELLRNRRVVLKVLNPEVLPHNVEVEQH